MWRFYLIGTEKPYGEIWELPYRWLAVDGIGWWLVNLSNHVVLDRLGIYRLGSWLIGLSDKREKLITRVQLSEQVLGALSWSEDE